MTNTGTEILCDHVKDHKGLERIVKEGVDSERRGNS